MVLASLSVFAGGCPPESAQPVQSVQSPVEPGTAIAGTEKPQPSDAIIVADNGVGVPDIVNAGSDMDTDVSPHGILWAIPQNAGVSSLSLRDPDGVVSQLEFPPGEAPYLNVAGLADGLYVYEVLVEPALSARTAAAMEEAADDPVLRESVVQQLVDAGQIPGGPVGQSGSFMVAGGAILPGDSLTKGRAGDQDVENFNKDQVINDDLIVSFSACVGNDCVNGESFGFDTIRLKENNLRIRFQDTSNSASFPSNDWQIVANDSSNGGQNRFSIEDVDGGRTPFTIEAGADANALYVDTGGRIGMGTNNPVTEIHVKDGDSPTLRLEQDGSSGFTPQTWDMAGNETNFFIRDVTNGSKLPIRIRPNAPTNSLYIDTDGDIGLGTASPAADLHVLKSAASPAMRVESTNSTPGSPSLSLKNSSVGWSMGVQGASGKLVINNLADFNSGTSANEAIAIDNSSLNVTLGRDLDVRRIVRWGDGTNQVGRLLYSGSGNPVIVADPNKSLEFWTGFSGNGVNRLTINASGNTTVQGNLTVNGTLSNPSDRNIKDEIENIDPKDVLEKVVGMPISSWRYKREDGRVRHIGPMAQDFMAAFGLGEDERYITAIDADGVSLAAIQGLNQKIEEKDAIIAQQARALQELADRVAALEQAAQK